MICALQSWLVLLSYVFVLASCASYVMRLPAFQRFQSHAKKAYRQFRLDHSVALWTMWQCICNMMSWLIPHSLSSADRIKILVIGINYETTHNGKRTKIPLSGSVGDALLVESFARNRMGIDTNDSRVFMMLTDHTFFLPVRALLLKLFSWLVSGNMSRGCISILQLSGHGIRWNNDSFISTGLGRNKGGIPFLEKKMSSDQIEQQKRIPGISSRELIHCMFEPLRKKKGSGRSARLLLCGRHSKLRHIYELEKQQHVN